MHEASTINLLFPTVPLSPPAEEVILYFLKKILGHIHHLNDPVSVIHVVIILFLKFLLFLTAEIRKAWWFLMLSQPQFLPFLSLLFPLSGNVKIVQQKGRPLVRGLV